MCIRVVCTRGSTPRKGVDFLYRKNMEDPSTPKMTRVIDAAVIEASHTEVTISTFVHSIIM